MYHHFKMQKARDPCGEMGGLTRLLTWRGEPPAEVVAQMPTAVVEEDTGGGYRVINRPHSMVLFLKTPQYAAIREEYIYIAETDHILLRPMPNLATETTPAAFHFGYMLASGQANIVEKFVPGLGGKTDDVGPSPLIIHKKQLEAVAGPWLDYSRQICKDREAVQALGWVREMWGYTIAAAKLGIKHRVMEALQFEGGSIGTRTRQLAWPVAAYPVGEEGPLHGEDGQRMPFYIFHYTYGIEYSREGLPMELQVGEWSFDKRVYMSRAPPRGVKAPPVCGHDRAHVLRALINNGSASVADWKGGGVAPPPADPEEAISRAVAAGVRTGGVEGARLAAGARDRLGLRGDATAARLLGTGPWKMTGSINGNSFRLDSLYVLNAGYLVSQKGHGRWSPKGGGKIELSICQHRLLVRLDRGARGWRLTSASDDLILDAALDASDEALAAWSAADVAPTAKAGSEGAAMLASRVEGTGPYRGNRGHAYVLRAGVLSAEGALQRYTRWRADDATRLSLSKGGGAPLGCDEGGSCVAFTDCYIMRLADDGAAGSIGAHPAQYGRNAEKNSLEWILKPKATLCEDACGGLTLRKLTPADAERSSLARALVESGATFSWAGFGGLKFHEGGRLQTPWGAGIWGAPPEAQQTTAGKGPAVLAEFFGRQHLLRARVSDGVVKAMTSTRCDDNDRSDIRTASGSVRIA